MAMYRLLWVLSVWVSPSHRSRNTLVERWIFSPQLSSGGVRSSLLKVPWAWGGEIIGNCGPGEEHASVHMTYHRSREEEGV